MANYRRFFASIINATLNADLDAVVMRPTNDGTWAIYSHTIPDALKARRFRSAVAAFEALYKFRQEQKRAGRK